MEIGPELSMPPRRAHRHSAGVVQERGQHTAVHHAGIGVTDQMRRIGNPDKRAGVVMAQERHADSPGMWNAQHVVFDFRRLRHPVLNSPARRTGKLIGRSTPWQCSIPRY